MLQILLPLTELCLFLLLLNFDAFLTGLAFGFAGVRITNAACLLVSGLGALFLGLSMSAGGWLSALLHTELLSRLALVFLLLFTLYLIVKYCGKEGRGQLGGLWRRPARLDNNADKQISPGEAAWLGVALAVDSVGGGLALGMLLPGPWVSAGLSALFCFCLLAGSNRLAYYIVHNLQK